jgi:hypothetical protein
VIRRSGMIASKSFAGGTTNAKFIDFIRDDLCPHFHRGVAVFCIHRLTVLILIR